LPNSNEPTPNSGTDGFWLVLLESSGGCRSRNQAIGYQNLRTFGVSFGLLTNSNARQRRIPTNVPSKMKNLNPEKKKKKDLRFLKL